MTAPPVFMEDVRRGFDGIQALDGADLRIEAGTITGLLGVNGAGKTTLMRTFLGLVRPDSGRCELFGETSWEASETSRGRIGFVPQSYDGFKWMTVDEAIAYTRAFHDDWDDDFVAGLVDRFELQPDRQIHTLSVGMQQRVAITLAWGHRPDLLVLDEPVAALDPVGRRTFIEMLLDVHMSQGNTIVFSTHITADVERVAARVALMQAGKVVVNADLEDLKESWCRLHVHGPGVGGTILADVPGCVASDIQGQSARLVLERADPAWMDALRREQDVQFEVERMNLDEIFLAVNAR